MSTRQEWDIDSGVGVTALAVATGRAIETRRDDGLVTDPHAATLVRAADPPIPMPADAPGGSSLWEQAANYIGVRSRYFDTWFERACSAGVQQAVILASGLDTRAFRMSWPAGFRVFEVDQPKVLEFKDSVLGNTSPQGNCEHHAIGVDLRDDWAGALENAGFDTGVPTAWLAEGLLPYLPAEAEQQLLETVHAFSAPGSHLAIEEVTGARTIAAGPALQEASREWGIDLASLMSTEQRPDPADRLDGLGWTTTREALDDVAARFGRDLDGIARQLAAHGFMLTAQLPR